LTQEQAVKAAGLLGPARAALKSMEEAVKSYVETNGPITFSDGRVYGPHPSEETDYHARAAHDALVAEIEPLVGPERAREMADNALSISKSGIYDAIAQAHETVGIKRRKAEAFDRITSVPGVATTRATTRWGAHYPKKTQQ
jgi:hypothetical protein